MVRIKQVFRFKSVRINEVPLYTGKLRVSRPTASDTRPHYRTHQVTVLQSPVWPGEVVAPETVAATEREEDWGEGRPTLCLQHLQEEWKYTTKW